MQKKLIMCAIFVAYAKSLLFSQFYESSILNQADIKSMSMANSCIGLADASGSFIESPAITADLEQPQLLLSYGDIKQYNHFYNLTLSYPTSGDAISGALRYFQSHEINNGLNQAWDVNFNFSKIFSEKFYFGLGIKLLSLHYQEQSGLSFGLNLGAIYHYYKYNINRKNNFIQNIKVGFSLLNIGNPLYYGNQLLSPPIKIKMGPAIILNITKEIQTRLSTEADIEFNKFHTGLNLGMETILWKYYKARFGYALNSNYENQCFGLGYLIGKVLEFNYTFTYLKNKTSLHYMGIELGADLFTKKPIQTKKIIYLEELKKTITKQTSRGMLQRAPTENKKYYYDQILIIQTNHTIKPVLYNHHIEFEYNRDDLNTNARVVLNKIYTLIHKYSNYQVLIEGHTDSIGEINYNQYLSERRAQAVCNYLVYKGIKAEKLFVKGWGYAHPIASNRNPDGTDNPEGRLKNRRFELLLIKTNYNNP